MQDDDLVFSYDSFYFYPHSIHSLQNMATYQIVSQPKFYMDFSIMYPAL